MELILATNNAHKVEEFSRILAPLGIVVRSQKEFCPNLEVEENGATFAANARLKAEAFYKATGLAAVADDSGLCVDALNGAPGVYSARFAGPGATDAQRIQKLLDEMQDVPDEQRTARFVSAICCIGPDGLLIECQGVCEGRIGRQCRGEGGFGYDPVFYVGDRSYAQMTGEEKDAVSHRGRALRLFYDEMNRRMNRADQ